MRDIKMRIAGIADDKVLFRPVIILKNSSGKTFPVPSTFQSSSSLIDAFVNKTTIHSELITKLIELTEESIDKIVLEKSKTHKLITRVYGKNKKRGTASSTSCNSTSTFTKNIDSINFLSDYWTDCNFRIFSST